MPYPIKNSFYVLSGINVKLSNTYMINVNTGQSVISNGKDYETGPINIISQFSDRLYAMAPNDIAMEKLQVCMFGAKNTYLGYRNVEAGKVIELDKNTQYVICNINHKLDFTNLKREDRDKLIIRIWIYTGKECVPHYKSIKKKYKKENTQIFFRESIDGKISLFAKDYEHIMAQSLESKFIFTISRNSKVISLNQFTKTDCKIDFARKKIEPKLSPVDQYSNILDKYDNTYDLIKCSPAITPLTLTKRMAYQIYIKGGKTISTFANGIYYEDEVKEQIDDENALKRKYFFALNKTFTEISISSLTGFSSTINGTYKLSEDRKVWIKTDFTAFIRLYTKSIYNPNQIYNLSDGNLRAAGQGAQGFHKLWKIELYSGRVPDDMKDDTAWDDPIMKSNFASLVYTSDRWYYLDELRLTAGAEYPMSQSGDWPSGDIFPKFNLGNEVIEYKAFARVLADVDKVTIGGTSYNLKDLPYDDFAVDRANYKKCIGIIALDIMQSSNTVDTPTKFGMNDYGNYFTSNSISYVTSGKPMPVCRSSWANTSIWAFFGNEIVGDVNEPLFRKTYTLKDAYSIGAVIKALLLKIDPSIKHEETEEYSKFLYAQDSPLMFDYARSGCRLYITPKSNVLKGNYDQAAQKAEISFKQLMNVLRDCFRCYWFIEDGKLKIEHISYFLNGRTYHSSEISSQIQANYKVDKFNRKSALYFQGELSFTKEDLSSRYEFAWMDDSSELFEDAAIDVNSNYIQKDKTENINSELFSTDIDLMLLAPNKFSNDGFVLLVAKDKKVPIVGVSDLRDDEYAHLYSAKIQNYLASWLYLIRYYMYDMPAENISYNRAPEADAYRVQGVKRCLSYDIDLQSKELENIDLYKPISTSLGNGFINSISLNIDTDKADISLLYQPKALS